MPAFVQMIVRECDGQAGAFQLRATNPAGSIESNDGARVLHATYVLNGAVRILRERGAAELETDPRQRHGSGTAWQAAEEIERLHADEIADLYALLKSGRSPSAPL